MTLYSKYKVEKTDGSPVDPQAQYFVLRVDTDPAAREAVKAYAHAIKDLDFAVELMEWVEGLSS